MAPDVLDPSPGARRPAGAIVTNPGLRRQRARRAAAERTLSRRLAIQGEAAQEQDGLAPAIAAGTTALEAASDAVNRLASYGLVVVPRHSAHLTTLYAHLDDGAHGLLVQAGDEVRQGQVIGYVGLTGHTTGPHLHFEVRADTRPLDPLLLVTP